MLSTSRKTPESFLGDKFTNLVNLDQLVTDTKSNFQQSPLLFISFHIQVQIHSVRMPPEHRIHLRTPLDLQHSNNYPRQITWLLQQVAQLYRLH